MKIVSLFSGIGGFEKGILQADPTAEIIFASEKDKFAKSIYRKQFGVEPHGDIKKINASDVPEHDILCGGFPCQDISIAGKREGLCGARSGLFYEIIRILREKQPKLVFLENVKGILSSYAGWDFARILIELENVGYLVEWQVLNTAAWLPQNRERVFIIGHLATTGGSTRKIFPIRKINEQVPKKRDGVNMYAGTISTRNQSGQAQWDGSTTLICNAIDANYYKGPDTHGQRTAILCDSGPGRKSQIRDENISPLRANTGAGHNNVVCHSTLPRSGDKSKGGTGHLQRNDGLTYCCDTDNTIAVEIPDIAKCLTGGGNSGGNHSDMTFFGTDKKIRRLTPTEVERLQGFPDGWTAEGKDSNGNTVKISDTQRYKCLGNAVTVPVIEFIYRHIMDVM